MPSINPGRNVGRVSIRVMPDTTMFRKDAQRKLDRIADDLSVKVRLKVDATKAKQIQRELQNAMDRAGEVTKQIGIDKAEMRREKMRKLIQAQLEALGDFEVVYRALVKNKPEFEREVKKLTDKAERNEVQIPVNVMTTLANAQLRYTARTRVVTILVKVGKKSLAAAHAALASIAAMSGARVAFKWIDDLANHAKNLDKNLPSLLGWTTGITSLVAALATATGGVIGFGAGLVSMAPALLVVPGLAINALGSLTALFVALKDSKNQLKPLGDDMNELGEIINTTYWDRARKPIIELVKNLMPQLRNSFRDLSEGIGGFTADLARSFEKELGGGRLESIFRGIADGWRILGTGAPGFAGAIVSLSQIAATYTPRLAGWFVRQANTFDAWLKAIATDGRLGTWMEGAIESMYDLWDATTGLAGTFAGLWKGLEKAGSGGLKGLAQMMQTWERVVNGADFQSGLEHFMRGSYVAMDRLVDSMKAIGRIFVDLGPQIERFVGASGTFFFGIVEGLANALNSPVVGAGLDRFSAGLLKGLDKIGPSLQPFADTFGGFLGLLGRMSETVLPSAVNAISRLMPSVDAVIRAVEPVLPVLADALGKVTDALAPAIEEFVEAMTPAFQSVISSLADALVDLTPVISDLLFAVGDLVTALGGWAEDNKGFWDGLVDGLGADSAWKRKLDDAVNLPGKQQGLLNWSYDGSSAADQKKIGEQIAETVSDAYAKTLERKGQKGVDALLRGLQEANLPAPIASAIRERLLKDFDLEFDLRNIGVSGGGGLSWGLAHGVRGRSAELDAAVLGLRGKVSGKVQDSAEWLKPAGANVMHGFGSALTGALTPSIDPLGGLSEKARAKLADSGGWLTGNGAAVAHSFGAGLTGALPAATAPLAGLNRTAQSAVAGAGGWLTGPGASAMHSFGVGLNGALPNATHAFALLSTKARIAVAGSGTWLTAPGSETIHGFNRGVVAAVPGVSAAFRDVPGRVRGAVPNPGGLLWGVGSSIISGLVNGIWSGASAVANAIRSVAYSAVNAGKVALKINSPSKVFRDEIGASIGEGLVAGIDRSRKSVSRAVSGLVDPSDAATTLPFSAGRGGVPLGTQRTTNITFVNPVTRDTLADAREAAELVNAVG